MRREPRKSDFLPSGTITTGVWLRVSRRSWVWVGRTNRAAAPSAVPDLPPQSQPSARLQHVVTGRGPDPQTQSVTYLLHQRCDHDKPTNGQKGNGDAATWLPPNKSYRCTYVTRQVQVKAEYGLWVTQAEKDAITRVLSDCGAATAPGPDLIPSVPTTTVAPPPPLPAPVPQEPAPAPAPSGGAVYFKNCSAARAAGAAPIYVGEPGYRGKLDRDGDGVACE